VPGRYAYAVHQFSADGRLGTSEARVVVYAGSSIVRAFTVPPSATAGERWWHVFDLDGATGTVTPVDTLSSGPPVPSSVGR
jgi:hypothetical protein